MARIEEAALHDRLEWDTPLFRTAPAVGRRDRAADAPLHLGAPPRDRAAGGHSRSGQGRMQARLVAEGANGPTSIEADEILAERDILVLPDILTNAGGVTVSYFEWVQDRGRLFWDRAEIRRKLTEKLNDAFDRVWAASVQRDVSLRTAALVTGIREVPSALDARGLYP